MGAEYQPRMRRTATIGCALTIRLLSLGPTAYRISRTNVSRYFKLLQGIGAIARSAPLFWLKRRSVLRRSPATPSRAPTRYNDGSGDVVRQESLRSRPYSRAHATCSALEKGALPKARVNYAQTPSRAALFGWVIIPHTRQFPPAVGDDTASRTHGFNLDDNRMLESAAPRDRPSPSAKRKAPVM